MDEQVEKIKGMITDQRKILISRVPEQTKKHFIEFANKDFCGDYGMTLKHILDFYFGLVPTGWEHLEIEINVMKEQINKLIAKSEEKKEVKKRCNGA